MKSEFITDHIRIIEESIRSGIFKDVERSKLELKDLSGGTNWKSLKESIAAFLNTDGGVVFCGIRERNKHYTLTGFDRNNESIIVKLHTEFFKDDRGAPVDLSDFISFDYFPLLDKEIVAIMVRPLSYELKYICFEGHFFERKLTQDTKIPLPRVLRQKEYKAELEYAKELSIVEGARVTDLSLDKVNKYIDLLNREIKRETLRPSLLKAKNFLAKQHFLKEGKVSMLGMLVCGRDPFQFISSRAEVDCYYDSSSEISKDKKIFRNDVISLMDDAFRFIWRHIKVASTVKDGGRSEPEYPEKLIREVVNNALAHRDYTVDNFITVTVEPRQWIEIKNPGRFKEKIKIAPTHAEIPIRRLVPGIPESKNPKLSAVLKVFDKIESQGRGMASLLNAALDNQIDLPYYELRDEMISLKIPSGKLLDDAMEAWLAGFGDYIKKKLQNQISLDHKVLLAYSNKSEQRNREGYFTILLCENNHYFAVLNELKNAGLLMEHPDSRDEHPVWVLNRVLMKTDFKDKLISIIGDRFIEYDPSAKEILQILYLHTEYNKRALKACEITPEVYRRLYGKQIVAKTFESLGRKVRSFCSQFEGEGLLFKGEKNAYSFNIHFKEKDKQL